MAGQMRMATRRQLAEMTTVRRSPSFLIAELEGIKLECSAPELEIKREANWPVFVGPGDF
jgi:hypothetical protein